MPFFAPMRPIVPYYRYLGAYVDTSSPASYTFSNVDFGQPASGRVIVVVAGNRDSAGGGDTYPTATIGGVTADNTVSAVNSVLGIAIKSARVPTGTSGTVTLSLIDPVDHTWIAVYALYGLLSPTAVDTDSATDANSFSALVARPNGIIIAGGVATSGTSFAPTNLTEHYDADVETARYTAAANQGILGSSTYAASLTGSGTRAIVAASWR